MQSLSEFISKNEFCDNYKAATDVIGQMISIIKYLHTNGIMHRNLTPDSFIIDTVTHKLQLLDLGTCCEIGILTERPNTNILFSAPEMITKEGTYDKSVDIFSIGIIYFMMLYGISP